MLLRRLAVFLPCLLGTVLTGLARGEAPPESLVRLASVAPGELQGVGYLRTGADFQDWFFGLVPFGQQYREVLEERGGAFAKRTGLDPLRDLAGLGVAVSRFQGSPHMLFFLDLRKSSLPLAKVLAEDQSTKGRLRFSSPNQATLGESSLYFLPEGILFGPTRSMELRRGEDDRVQSSLPAQAAAAASASARLMVGWNLPVAARAPDPDSPPPASPAQAFAAARQLFVGMDAESLWVRLNCDRAESAEFFRKSVAEGIEKGLRGLQEAPEGSSADPDKAGVWELVAPDSVAREASRRWSRKFLADLSLGAEGTEFSLVHRGDLLKSPLTFLSVPAIGMAAAIAVPNFRKARQKAQRRACFATQKVLAGATEMYNLDHNTDITELTPKLLQQYIELGYLRQIPEDPGQGEGTTDHFYLVPGKSGLIACRVHGSVNGEIPGSEPDLSAPSPSPSLPVGALPALGGLLQGLLPKGTGPSFGPGGSGPASRPRFRKMVPPPPPTRRQPGKFRQKAVLAACFANQKTLAAALEMYRLDTGIQVGKLDRAMLDKLVSEGYLRAIPNDPGEAGDSWAHYQSDPQAENGITCVVHGDVSGKVPGKK